MSRLVVYDSNDNFRQYTIPCQRNTLDGFGAQSSGTKTINGRSYNIIKYSSGNILQYTIETGTEGMDLNKWNEDLPGLGFPCAGFNHFDVSSGYFTETAHTFNLSGKSTVLTSHYYQAITNQGGNLSSFGVSGSSGGVINDEKNACAPVLFEASNDSTSCFGFIHTANSNVNGRLYILIDRAFTVESYGLTIEKDPGDKGFRPIGNRTRITIGGGSDSNLRPGYNTDHLSQPGAPNESVASVIGAGFINVYKVSTGNLVKLGKCLFSETWDQWISNVFRNPMDSLVSLQIFPCSPNVGSAQPIKLLKYNCVMADLSEDVSAPVLSSQFKVYDFGTLTVAEMWESFLDYDATSFQLYLPFIGTVDIPVNEVMNGSVNVQYTVDFLTGMCVANVLCTKTVEVSDGGTAYTQESQHSYMGNCAVQIPLNSATYGNIIGALAQASSVALTSGIAGAVGSLAMSAFSGGFKPTVETKGAITSNAGFCSVLYPYITITRPITAEPESYQEVMGYPSYIESTLGACEDLCICDNIDLSGITGATESEMNRIKQACKEGVYV